MRLEVRIPHKFAGADSCAVDYQIEIAIGFFEFFEADARVDFAASFLKTSSEIIEINRRVHKRDP